MPNVSDAVRFRYGSQSSYDVSDKDTNSVYFASDTCRLFVGSKEYTRPVLKGPSVPSISTVPKSLYVRTVAATSSVPAHTELYYNETGTASGWILLSFESIGSVRYDMIQSLTGTQKTQARSNIGAASAEDLTNHINNKSNPHSTTAAQVGADPAGTASSMVGGHNTSTSSHSDIRLLISDLAAKLNNFLDVDDTTSDQLSEVLDLINNNKGTLESLTTSKVNVTDIIDNLTTPSTDKILSASQGVAIKSLIDALQTELETLSNSVSEIKRGSISVDSSLSIEGRAADAKAVGDEIDRLESEKVSYEDDPVYFSEESSDNYAESINADTLCGHPVSDFALAYDVENLTAEEVGATPKSHAEDKNNPHSVTAEQVGAAPAGYGLGRNSYENLITTKSQLDAMKVNGWFLFDGSKENITVSGMNISYAYGRVDSYEGNRAKMTLIPVVPERLSTLVRYASGSDGVWCEWEWVNPPMSPGVEYRTTERFWDEPVYCKVVKFGTLPNNSSKEVAENTPSKYRLLRYNISTTSSNEYIDKYISRFLFTNSSIKITTNSDMSNFSVYVHLYYIKEPSLSGGGSSD